MLPGVVSMPSALATQSCISECVEAPKRHLQKELAAGGQHANCRLLSKQLRGKNDEGKQLLDE